MTYAEMAPVISSTGITKKAIENYFAALPEPTPATPDPEITKAKVQALADKVYDGLDGIAKHGGIIQIASDCDLTPGQVKSLINEMNVLKAAWDEAKAPELPVE